MPEKLITPKNVMASCIELWPLDKLVPFERNARTHPPEQVAQIAASIMEFGFNAPILVDSNAGIIAGHGRLLAARKLGLPEVPVIILDHLTGNQKRAYILADNKLTEAAGWDDAVLSSELATLRDADFDLEMLGFEDDELRVLLAQAEAGADESGESRNESIPEAPVEPVTRPGDLWLIGKQHRLICGDSRDYDVLARLLNGVKANVVVTSPPYATQREYDSTSGFQPVRPEEYVEWFRDVAKNIAVVLAPGGSYFLNIKEHCAEGERSLYVMDLVIAHKRQWGWRFVDQLCWRKTDNGVPGHWHNRFKNAWEPVFHFCLESEVKFRPKAAGHVSENCFDYSPNNPKSTSGSGLLGTGPRGNGAAELGSDDAGRFTGIARPSNVIEVKTETSQGLHSAPFPRALAEFFVKAFSDPGDIICDMFVGSGTVIAAAQVLNRAGYGVEISPGYCDVALRRIAHLTGEEPVLAETGATMCQVAAERGVPHQQAHGARPPRSTVANPGGSK